MEAAPTMRNSATATVKSVIALKVDFIVLPFRGVRHRPAAAIAAAETRLPSFRHESRSRACHIRQINARVLRDFADLRLLAETSGFMRAPPPARPPYRVGGAHSRAARSGAGRGREAEARSDPPRGSARRRRPRRGRTR